MDLFSGLMLIGGVALLLYGMNVMGSGLEKLSGGRLEKILEKLTSNKLKGVLLGAGVTGVIQSSAATTVMVVGFINSGIMKLSQSVGVIMGANIGTTVTAWILSLTRIDGSSTLVQLFKPSSLAPVLAAAGILLMLAAHRGYKKDLGSVLMGLAVLLFGMLMMSEAVEPLKDAPWLADIISLFSNPVLGVLVGALLTAVLQSSSASVGVLQAMSATGLITFAAALPIICGQNIGTCVTAMLSSAGANRNAKRAALIHLMFNIIGTTLFLTVFYTVRIFVEMPFLNGTVDAFSIAVVHTAFNLFGTAVMLPFSGLLVKLSEKLIQDKPESEEFALLDERFLASPSFALEHCRTVTCSMGELARDNLLDALNVIDAYSEKAAERINKDEDRVDMYEDKLGSYLVKLSAHELSDSDTNEASVLLSAIGDFERISDHAVNILEAAQEMHGKEILFSGEAKKELGVIISALTDIVTTTVDAFVRFDRGEALHVEPLEEVIDLLRTELKARHIKRLQESRCTIEYGFVYSDLLTNFERVSDHCSNIAISVLQTSGSTAAEPHSFVSKVVVPGADYSERLAGFKEKYFAQLDS